MKHSLRKAALFVSCVGGSMANASTPEFPPPPPSPEFVGAYIGYAPIVDFNTDDDIWVRRGALQLDGDRIVLHTGTLICRQSRAYASESDGGFFEYAGSISGPQRDRIATLHYVGCDYCIRKIGESAETYTLKFRTLDEGAIELGGVRMDRHNPPFPEHCPMLVAGSMLPPELPEDEIERP